MVCHPGREPTPHLGTPRNILTGRRACLIFLHVCDIELSRQRSANVNMEKRKRKDVLRVACCNCKTEESFIKLWLLPPFNVSSKDYRGKPGGPGSRSRALPFQWWQARRKRRQTLIGQEATCNLSYRSPRLGAKSLRLNNLLLWHRGRFNRQKYLVYFDTSISLTSTITTASLTLNLTFTLWRLFGPIRKSPLCDCVVRQTPVSITTATTTRLTSTLSHPYRKPPPNKITF